jgi:hypothetical protein
MSDQTITENKLCLSTQSTHNKNINKNGNRINEAVNTYHTLEA